MAEERDSITRSIDSLKSVLGTMVLVPTEIKDPSNIGGQVTYGAPVQRPIIEGKNREVVLNKLLELINQL